MTTKAKKTKRWAVTLPVTGFVTVEVDAATEQEAIDAALESSMPDELDEWQIHEEVVSGNVFNGALNNACAVETEE